MSTGIDRSAELKKRAALAAVAEVKSGMRLGLGTGSTAAHAVDAIGRMLQRGEIRDIVGVPTSHQTAELATAYGIPLVGLEEAGRLDLAIDGADEVDPACDLIKGGGGALLREKAVELRAARFVVIVDGSKLSDKLGRRFALPVEIAQNGWEHERDQLARLGCATVLRYDARGPFVTESGNFIVDCRFPDGIDDKAGLAAMLDERPNVRAHGLVLGMASEVVVAEADGIRRLTPR